MEGWKGQGKQSSGAARVKNKKTKTEKRGRRRELDVDGIATMESTFRRRAIVFHVGDRRKGMFSRLRATRDLESFVLLSRELLYPFLYARRVNS